MLRTACATAHLSPTFSAIFKTLHCPFFTSKICQWWHFWLLFTKDPSLNLSWNTLLRHYVDSLNFSRQMLGQCL